MSIQVQRKQSGLPCAMVLRLIRALPGDQAFLSPSPLRSFRFFRNLTPTLGRRDHTLSPYASMSNVLRHNASTAACPDVSDVGLRPLLAGQDERGYATNHDC